MSTPAPNPDLATALQALERAELVSVKAVGLRHLVDVHRSRRLDLEALAATLAAVPTRRTLKEGVSGPCLHGFRDPSPDDS